jgi:hypothetical protein
MTPRITDVLDEEGLAFEESPADFVLLDRTPIVWHVRGIRYFAPRLRLAGIDICGVTTPEQFRAALRRWDAIEWQVLVQRIESRAESGVDGSAHQCLWAILTGDPQTKAMIDQLNRLTP